MDIERYIKRADERDALIARAEAAEARAAELEQALRLAVEWLDEVTNPDNSELQTAEGVAVRQEIQKVLGE